MKTRTLAILASVSVLAMSCGVMNRSSAASPEMISGDITVWTISGVAFNNADFSGLSFSADGKRMIAAFNSAALYWLEIPSKAGESLKLSPFDVEGSGFHEVKRDIECVTLGSKSGDIYYGQERDATGYKGASVYRLRAPKYDKEELVVSFDKETIPDGNSGIEGLTWLGGDNFIVGREGGTRRVSPMMIFYSESKGITEKIVPPAEIRQIAEIVYDDVRDCLWILDGDFDKILYRCDMKGNVIDRYPVPDIKNAEALLLDRKHGCVWIGSDEEPSKLYRIGFKNL